jgi:hypothetical protein
LEPTGDLALTLAERAFLNPEEEIAWQDGPFRL